MIRGSTYLSQLSVDLAVEREARAALDDTVLLEQGENLGAQLRLGALELNHQAQLHSRAANPVSYAQ